MSDANYDPSAGDKQDNSDAGVGGAVYRETARTGPSTQSTPRMNVHTSTDRARIKGIVAQCRADVGARGPEELERVIRQRLKQAHIELDDESIRKHAGS